MRALPQCGAAGPQSVAYGISRSRSHWPDQAGLAEWISEAGWQRVRWRNLSGGVVAPTTRIVREASVADTAGV